MSLATKIKDASIITIIDVAKKPLFVLNAMAESESERQFFLNGELCTRISGPLLSQTESDVFYALLYLGKQQKFKSDKIEFELNILLQVLKWTKGGKEYNRLKLAIDNLSRAQISIKNVFGDGSMGFGKLNMFSAYYIHPKKSQAVASGSWIKLHPQLLEKCRQGLLKSLHPLYFDIRSPIAKRLFAIVSLYASDLDEWRVPLLFLKEALPLQGESYAKLALVSKKLNDGLQILKNMALIHDFKLCRAGTLLRDASFKIMPNPDYYFSLKRARKSPGEEETVLPLSPKYSELEAKLINLGIDAHWIAKTLQDEKRLEKLMQQLAHYEFLLQSGKIVQNPAAWVVMAVEKNYALPAHVQKNYVSLKEQEQKAIDTKIDVLLEKAKYLFEAQDCKKAIALLENSSYRTHERVQKQLHDFRATLQTKNQLNAYLNQLDVEAKLHLFEEVWKNVATEAKITIGQAKESTFCQFIFQQKLLEKFSS